MQRLTSRESHLLEVINKLPPDVRTQVVEKLRECDPKTKYFTSHDGRVDIQ